MRLIVAGGRDYTNTTRVFRLLNKLLLEEPTLEIISGLARGADTLGRNWAKMKSVPYHDCPADWDNVDVPGAIIRYHKDGRPYNAGAGNQRNQHMANICDSLLVFWDGKSTGTKNMISIAIEMDIPMSIVRY